MPPTPAISYSGIPACNSPLSLLRFLIPNKFPISDQHILAIHIPHNMRPHQIISEILLLSSEIIDRPLYKGDEQEASIALHVHQTLIPIIMNYHVEGDLLIFQ